MTNRMTIDDEDFRIRIRPSVEDGGEWTGEIDISIISQPDNPLNDEGYGQIMHFCKMMCATVPLMESDEQLRDTVHSYVLEVVDNEPEDMYMVLPTKIDAGSRTRTRGFYLTNGPYDLFRSQYTADADASISTAKEVDAYESTNQSYGWNWNNTPYSNPIDTSYG